MKMYSKPFEVQEPEVTGRLARQPELDLGQTMRLVRHPVNELRNDRVCRIKFDCVCDGDLRYKIVASRSAMDEFERTRAFYQAYPDLGIRPVALAPGADYDLLVLEHFTGQPLERALAAGLAGRNPWLERVVCSPLRARFLEQRPPPAGARILDIGAGWGQFTLPLARAGEVCALEPTPERMDFIRAAAEQEGLARRICCVQADYLELEFATRFDVILCIGVLEWVGRFSRAGETDARAAQQRFLEQARRDLAPGGRLVIGIENRLGLKYWLGAPDDHLGRPHIMLFDRQLAAANPTSRNIQKRPAKTMVCSK